MHAYGTDMPLTQVGTVAVPEARMITVQVWDRSLVSAVENAIRDAGLGLNPMADGQLVRVPIPQLTAERRNELAKAAHNYAEGAKVAVRGVRRDGMEQIKALEKKAQISEDDEKHWHDEVQKLTDAYIKRVDERWPRRKRKSSRSELVVAIQVASGYARPRAEAGGGRPPQAAAPGRAAPCRHHHGRQRPLGRRARPAADRRPSRRRPRGAPHHRGGDPPRRAAG